MNGQRFGVVRLLERAYGLIVQLGNLLQQILLLAFRGYWGWQFFQTGQGKLINHEKVVSFFTSLNIPQPDTTAWFVSGLECFGGLLLLVGFASRPVALLLTGNMVVAYLSVDEDRAKLLNIFSDPTPFLSADPFFFLLTALLVLCFGPGMISIDGIIAKVLASRSKQAHHRRATDQEND
jgi:putative oxidoreductase